MDAQRLISWKCASRSEVLSAAFELHEVAVSQGLAPEEATTLSLTLAERAGPIAKGGSEASVSFTPRGWHLEVHDGGGQVVSVADYVRPMPQVRASTLKSVFAQAFNPSGW